MGVSADRLAAAKAYLRVEGSEDDGLILDLCRAGMEYLANAGISEPEPGSGREAQYQLVLSALVLSNYDLRDPVITGTIVSQNPVFRQMLTQLKLTEPPVPESDTKS